MKSAVKTPLVLALLFLTFAANAADYVKHQKPLDPIFLDKSFYSDLSKVLPPPPKDKSIEQEVDEQMLLYIQQSRTPSDCARAQSEVSVDFDAFFKEPDGPLTQGELDQIRTLISAIDRDAYYFVDKLKTEYPRRRPFLYIDGLKPCVPKEVTLSYPSGHAAVSALVAMVAGDIFPAKAEQLKRHAEMIAGDRVLGGVHHPSDIAAGKLIAIALYQKFQKNKSFQTAFKSVTNFNKESL